MKRAATYCRVSHKDVERGISIDIQDEQNARAIEAGGWAAELAYVDDGISAYNDQIAARPQFAQMLQDAKAKRFDVLVIYKWDRLARKQVIFYQVLAELDRLGILVWCATESNDWLARGVSGLMAEQYSRMLSARMKDVRRWEASQGRHVGPVPWGFERCSGALQPTEAIRWPVRAFDLYATRRYGFSSLAEQLADEGAILDNGKPPTKFQIAEVLRHPAYIGKVRCSGETFDGLHAPVIDERIWQTTQDILQERGGAGCRRKVAVAPLLAGLARCSMCGMPMWYSGTRYYQCSGRLTKANTCSMGGVRCETAELHLIDSLQVLTQNTELMRAVAAEIDGLIAADIPAPPDTDAIRTKLRRVAQLYEDGLKTEEAYRREITALRAQLEAVPPPVAVPNAAAALELLQDIPTLLKSADPLDRRAVLQELFTSIALEPHAAAVATPRPAYRALLQRLDKTVTGEWAGWAPGLPSRTKIAA